VTGTVPSIPLIAASIMSKKLAEGTDGLVLDVKVGSGAFMRTIEDARTLASTMIDIGEGMGCRTRALLTSMDQPLGRAVGNANEVAEAIAMLKEEGPADYSEVCTALGVEMLTLAGRGADEARAELRQVIASGQALEQFRRFVEAQGGDPRVVDDPDEVLPQPPSRRVVEATQSGVVSGFDCAAVGRACGVLGGGRAKASDAIDHAVGIEVLVEIGDAVEPGTPLFTIGYRDDAKADASEATLREAIAFGLAGTAPVLIRERLPQG
jgi:thymidine phosphorylase